MAKKVKTDKATVEATNNGGKITVAALAQKFEVEARVLRQFIRAQGFKAPETKQEGFGPRAKYEWEADSKELKAIITAWETAQDSKASGE